MDTNARLIRAVQHATHRLASSGNFDLLMKDVLLICVQAVGAAGGTIYLHDSVGSRLKFQHVLPSEIADKLPSKDIPDNFGLAGEAFQKRAIVCREFAEKPQAEWSSFEKATGVGLRSIVAAPLMMHDEDPIGVVQLINKNEGIFNETDCAVLDTIASVATMAYSNYRLTEESTRASTLLGMGKVSHDIGNLAASLYATISYCELAVNGLKHAVEDKPVDGTVQHYIDILDPMSDDLKESVDRIVGYSRLISDISGGRELRPNMQLSPMAATILGSAMYLEIEARASHVELKYSIEQDAPATMHDELYIFRIVQNLVGNAIKAVKETISEDNQAPDEEDEEPTYFGEVVVCYCFDGENHIIEVRDTGPGMTQETIERILSGNARSQWDKASGSGWGMKIVLELTATHGGKLSISSRLGHGATFRVTLPHVPS